MRCWVLVSAPPSLIRSHAKKGEASGSVSFGPLSVGPRLDNDRLVSGLL
jgi:hypothetical protein